ncbi:MAG: FtsQ-type POTRA domain-containing protein [Neomegalonema sp.]|nr:FtsQ-type POTRA domain-containing protein [Neomegalonema sp.]
MKGKQKTQRHTPAARALAWWRSPAVKRVRLAWTPFALAGMLFSGLAAWPPARDTLIDAAGALHQALLARPELRVEYVAIAGAVHLSEKAIIEAVDFERTGRAALAFDLEGARERLSALGWVERASLAVRFPHTLAIEIEERRPAALWRSGGALHLLDASGGVIAPAASRADWAHLPLVVGPGANRALGEMEHILQRLSAAQVPVIGLSRIGQRRWDVEILDGPRLMLPEAQEGGEIDMALDTVLRWQDHAELFSRDIDRIDLRFPVSPTVRLTQSAAWPVAGAASEQRSASL